MQTAHNLVIVDFISNFRVGDESTTDIQIL